MMQIRNDATRYGAVAIFLHWSMAIMIIGLLALGLYMVRLPISLTKLRYYGWHKEYGLVVLGLVTLRLIWRFSNTTPPLNLMWVEKFAARSVHWLFYALMLALPVTGWLITSAAGLQVSLFGWVVLPNLIQPDRELLPLFAAVHHYLAYALIAALCLHVSAAFKHHFINRDGIFRRMWIW